MRNELQKRDGKRGLFTATFSRYGRAKGFQGRELVTVLFLDVRDAQGAEVTDHIWFKCGKGFSMLGMKEGDRVSFEARVKPYFKGYKGQRYTDGWSGDESGAQIKDYRLSFPTKLRIEGEKKGSPKQLEMFQ
jgi:hypothetical protein